MIRSDSTLVPPVTRERSPPDSRITGADSPVIADSSTDAMPSTISPSPGISSPASITTRSPLRSCDAEITSRQILAGDDPPRDRLLAHLAQRVGLRLAAALGDGLREVREQHGEPQPQRDRPIVNHSGAASRRRATRSRSNKPVVSSEPIATTNITGFL